MKAEDFINWETLSESITGNRETIKKYNIPSQHQDRISFLFSLIRVYLNGSPENIERDIHEQGLLTGYELAQVEFNKGENPVSISFQDAVKEMSRDYFLGIKEGEKKEKERILKLLK